MEDQQQSMSNAIRYSDVYQDSKYEYRYDVSTRLKDDTGTTLHVFPAFVSCLHGIIARDRED